MTQRSDVREGMLVRTSDGEKLGKIVRCGDSEFEIEKGFFFPREYLARFEDVSEVRDGDTVILAITADRLRELEKGEHREAAAPMAGFGSGQALEGDAGRVEASSDTRASRWNASGGDEEMRVPVAKEELEAEKREHEAGKVMVTKDVETEEREITVPVKKERVRVERRPGEMRAAGEDAFEEKTVSVPVREEEVEIRKRPVVKEEVLISKSTEEEQRKLSAEAREEHADIHTEGDIERGRGEPKE